MKWFSACLILFALPALAQTDPAGSMRIGDHQHGLPDFVPRTEFDDLKALVDDMGAALEDHIAGEPVVPPIVSPIDPPITPPSAGFDRMCAADGVIFCEDFETDLSQANKNRCAAGNDPSSGLCPMIQSDMVFEGNSSLQFTTDGGKYEDVSGIVSFPFAPVSTGWVYMSVRMRFGDGFLAFDDAGGFPGSNGVKWFLMAGDGKTCGFQGGEMVAYRGWRKIVQMYHSCGPGVRNEVPRNNFDHQPKIGQPPVCLYSDLINGDNSKCVDVQDDVWHQFEMAVFPAQSGQRGRVRLWMDGALIVDWESNPSPSSGFPWKAGPPFDEVFLTNYQTGFNRAHPGKTWRIWYDNLIVSTECITSCGQ